MIEKDEFEEIEKAGLSVHNPAASKDGPEANANLTRGKKQKSHQKNKKSLKGLSGDLSPNN